MGTIYDNEETLPKIKNDLQDDNDILKNIRDSVYTAEKIDPYTMLGKLNQILKINKGDKGDKGDTGAQGIGITAVTLTQEGGLDFTLSNGEHLYTSSVRGERGEQGTPANPLTIYPIGSIYITVSNTSPAKLFGGQWEQLPENYALWTATSGAGGTISAGLPNITGSTQVAAYNISNMIFTDAQGAFTGINTGYEVGVLNTNLSSTDTNTPDTLKLDANKSNSIYRNDINTVQPPAYKIYAWKRVA